MDRETNQEVVQEVLAGQKNLLFIRTLQKMTSLTCCQYRHKKLTSIPNPYVAKLRFSINRVRTFKKLFNPGQTSASFRRVESK